MKIMDQWDKLRAVENRANEETGSDPGKIEEVAVAAETMVETLEGLLGKWRERVALKRKRADDFPKS